MKPIPPVLLLCAAWPALAQASASPTQLVEAIASRMQSSYVFPAKAAQANKALLEQLRRGAYRQAAGTQLAEALTTHLRQETADKHIVVRYSDAILPPVDEAAAPSALEIARQESEQLATLRHINFGVARAERLPGNIGYLELGGFVPAAQSGHAIAAAMSLLQHTSALIIDLRHNRGGDPDTVALLAGYFFHQRTRLNDIYWRDGERTEQQWSAAHVAGPRYGADKRVYILTAQGTFSAAEDFSYAMKNLKRAIIVGETTGGGAHPGRSYRLDEHYEIFVPNGRSLSTITRTDWEGTGVIPDLALPADQALPAAVAEIQRHAWQQQPVYLRGSFNAWGLSHRLCPAGPASYSMQVALPPGQHRIRVASEDARAVEYGAVPGRQAAGVIALQEGGDDVRLDVTEAASYVFNVDLSAIGAPAMRITRQDQRNVSLSAGCSP